MRLYLTPGTPVTKYHGNHQLNTGFMFGMLRGIFDQNF